MKRRIHPEGKREKAERLKRLEERLAHELMGEEERMELHDLVAKLREKVAA